MKEIIENIIKRNKGFANDGHPHQTPPILAKTNKDAIGMWVTTVKNEEYGCGDFEYLFSFQSISKVILLLLCLFDYDKNDLFSNIGVQPSSFPYDSLMHLEANNNNVPLNPFLNTGGITMTSLIKGNHNEEKINRFLDLTRKISNNSSISINEEIYASEREFENRNRGIAYILKGKKIIDGNMEEILDLFFKISSVEGNCRDLARIASVFANGGVLPWNGERICSIEIACIIKTIMFTCGLYDASGEFAMKVGIPAKSGVSGGIMATVPTKMGVGVFSPPIDSKGNSVAGIKILEDFSKELQLNIFLT